MGGHSKGPESEERLMVSVFLSAIELSLLSRYLNVYYRRTRRLDVPLITALRVAPEPLPDTLKTELEGWTKAAGDLHSGVWPTQSELRLYYRTRAQGQSGGTPHQRQEETSTHFITELDIVFGDDEPFFGFERVQGGKVLEAKAGKWESVDLAYRRGSPGEPCTVVFLSMVLD